MGKMLTRVLSIGVVCGWSAAASAGPGHQEIDDAGGKRSTAQTTVGNGEMGTIGGNLTGPRGLPADLEDMYLFRIVDPAIFTARTDVNFGPAGLTNFDTQLYLFSLGPAAVDAFGLLGNDQAPGAVQGPSFIGNLADDGTAARIPGPGFYLLAISGAGRVPVSAGGLIFEQLNPTEVSGPDGPGGTQPHLDWTGAGPIGRYTIFLTGAGFAEAPVPTVSQWGLIAMGALLVIAGGVLIRRRRSMLVPIKIRVRR